MEGIDRNGRACSFAMPLGDDKGDAVKDAHDKPSEDRSVRVQIIWKDLVGMVFDSCRSDCFSLHNWTK